MAARSGPCDRLWQLQLLSYSIRTHSPDIELVHIWYHAEPPPAAAAAAAPPPSPPAPSGAPPAADFQPVGIKGVHEVHVDVFSEGCSPQLAKPGTYVDKFSFRLVALRCFLATVPARLQTGASRPPLRPSDILIHLDADTVLAGSLAGGVAVPVLHRGEGWSCPAWKTDRDIRLMSALRSPERAHLPVRSWVAPYALRREDWTAVLDESDRVLLSLIQGGSDGADMAAFDVAAHNVLRRMYRVNVVAYVAEAHLKPDTRFIHFSLGDASSYAEELLSAELHRMRTAPNRGFPFFSKGLAYKLWPGAPGVADSAVWRGRFWPSPLNAKGAWQFYPSAPNVVPLAANEPPTWALVGATHWGCFALTKHHNNDLSREKQQQQQQMKNKQPMKKQPARFAQDAKDGHKRRTWLSPINRCSRACAGKPGFAVGRGGRSCHCLDSTKTDPGGPVPMTECNAACIDDAEPPPFTPIGCWYKVVPVTKIPVLGESETIGSAPNATTTARSLELTESMLHLDGITPRPEVQARIDLLHGHPRLRFEAIRACALAASANGCGAFGLQGNICLCWPRHASAASFLRSLQRESFSVAPETKCVEGSGVYMSTTIMMYTFTGSGGGKLTNNTDGGGGGGDASSSARTKRPGRCGGERTSSRKSRSEEPRGVRGSTPPASSRSIVSAYLQRYHVDGTSLADVAWRTSFEPYVVLSSLIHGAIQSGYLGVFADTGALRSVAPCSETWIQDRPCATMAGEFIIETMEGVHAIEHARQPGLWLFAADDRDVTGLTDSHVRKMVGGTFDAEGTFHWVGSRWVFLSGSSFRTTAGDRDASPAMIAEVSHDWDAGKKMSKEQYYVTGIVVPMPLRSKLRRRRARDGKDRD